MSTYTQILYQIVFSTKNREHTLVRPNRDELYKYHLQQNEWSMHVQSNPGHRNKQDIATGHTSAVEAIVTSIGGLFSSPNLSSGFDEDYAEHLRQEARKKKKKGFRR